MSTASTDFERMLRDAIDRAAEQGAKRTRDLFALASDASLAVSNVTAGKAILELAPIDAAETIYRLYLRSTRGSFIPEEFGVFRICGNGYPIERWSARHRWEEKPDNPDSVYNSLDELRGLFVHLLSDPSSKLVILVEHLKRTQASTLRSPD